MAYTENVGCSKVNETHCGVAAVVARWADALAVESFSGVGPSTLSCRCNGFCSKSEPSSPFPTTLPLTTCTGLLQRVQISDRRWNPVSEIIFMHRKANPSTKAAKDKCTCPCLNGFICEWFPSAVQCTGSEVSSTRSTVRIRKAISDGNRSTVYGMVGCAVLTRANGTKKWKYTVK